MTKAVSSALVAAVPQCTCACACDYPTVVATLMCGAARLQVRRQTETEQWLILVVDGTQGMVRFVNRATKQYLGLVAGKLQLLNEPYAAVWAWWRTCVRP